MALAEEIIKGWGNPQITQLGMVAGNKGESMQWYAKLLNLNPWFRSNTKEQEIYFLGEKIELELELYIAFSGRFQVEIIEVFSAEKGIYADAYRQGNMLHHLGYYVSNIEQKKAQLKNAGIDIVQEGYIATKGGAVTHFAYLDTLKDCGIILELIETKLMDRVTVVQRAPLMRMGVITGDVKKVKV